MNDCFEGKRLYGDDFNFAQIQQWYEHESEGYANLGNKDKSKHIYGYHVMNEVHGFKKLKRSNFESVLGFGSAWGDEFMPIIKKIKNITIIEPSDNLKADFLGNIRPNYIKPEIDGHLEFSSDSFDLITCFGTLHHIPNVSFVIKELIRVLKPEGYILIREPIVSMGDWNLPRPGLTKNERGIPVAFFDNLFKHEHVEIISREYCFTMTSFFQKLLGHLIKRPIYTYKWFVIFDKIFSYIMKSNVHYHAKNSVNKIAPSSIFYVIKKTNEFR